MFGPAVPLTPGSFVLSLLLLAAGFALALVVHRTLSGLRVVSERSGWKIGSILFRVLARPLAILIGFLSLTVSMRRLEPIHEYLRNWQGLEEALALLVGAWVTGSLVRELIDAYGRPYVESTETDFDERILGLIDLTAAYLIYILGAAAALQALGVRITGFLASLGIAGLAVALAARTILSNLFGGLMLTTDRYIQPGHRIRVGDWVGDVEEITLYKTTLRTRDNLLVSIPNDVLMNETTVNYFLPESLTRVSLDVEVDYGSDLDRVTRIIQEVADECERVSASREPEVNVVGLGESGIQLDVLVWQPEPTGARRTRDALYRGILDRFERENVTIPYPHLDVEVRGTPGVESDGDP